MPDRSSLIVQSFRIVSDPRRVMTIYLALLPGVAASGGNLATYELYVASELLLAPAATMPDTGAMPLHLAAIVVLAGIILVNGYALRRRAVSAR